MLTPKPLAAAIAALAFACAGTAAAENRHKNEIDVLSYSWGISPGPAAAAGDLAGSAQSMGAKEPLTVHGTRTETVGALPLTPLDDTRLKGRNAPGAASRDILLGGHTVDAARKGQNALRSGPGTGEQKYMEFKLKEVLISGVIANGNPASTPKLDGIDAKPAIAINTPLRTLPNRSPVADGSSNVLMMGEKSPRNAPAALAGARFGLVSAAPAPAARGLGASNLADWQSTYGSSAQKPGTPTGGMPALRIAPVR